MKHNHRTGDVKRQCHSGCYYGMKDSLKQDENYHRRATERRLISDIMKGKLDPDEAIFPVKGIHSSDWWDWD